MRRQHWDPQPAPAAIAPVAAGAGPESERMSSRSPDPLEHFAPIELAVFELSGFPALLLPGLPSPWHLLAETLPAVYGAAERVRFAVASDAEHYRAARALSLPTFNAFEWTTFALAAELDRVSYPTTARWLRRKTAEPDLLFTPERCIGVGLSQPDRRTLSVGQVMASMGCRLANAGCD